MVQQLNAALVTKLEALNLTFSFFLEKKQKHF